MTLYRTCSINGIAEEDNLQEMVNDVHDWSRQNKMLINIGKCQAMHVFRAKRPLVLPDITIDGVSIPVLTQASSWE